MMAEPASSPTRVTRVANIGRGERRRRLIAGVGLLAVAGVGSVCLLAFHADRGWRVPIFIPFWAGMTGVLQWRAKTCVALAALGMRNLDAGNESITNPLELRQLKLQARRINLQSALLATALTAAIVGWP